MTDHECELLKTRVEHEYALAGEKYRDDLEAIERVRRLAQACHTSTNGNAIVGSAPETAQGLRDKCEQSAPSPVVESLTFMDRVRKVLPMMPSTFTLRDVDAALAFEFPGQDIKALSSALKRLVERNEITCIEVGRGRRPSKFQTNMEDVE